MVPLKPPPAMDGVPFLSQLGPRDREWVLARAEVRVLQRGEQVWREGERAEGFAFLVGGQVKLVKSCSMGRETIVELGKSGDLLCANAVWLFEPSCCSAKAMEHDTEVVIVPRRDVLQLIERSPTAGRVFLEQVIRRSMALCQRVDQLASGQVERRIGTLLLHLADRTGSEREGEGIWIPVPLSRQDLADLCGTTIETAIRVMSHLGKEGVIKTVPGGFRLIDRRRLERIASGSLSAKP